MLSRSNQKTQKKLNKIKVSLKAFETEKTWSLDDFEILKQLGKGRFGTVVVARQKISDYVVALKRMQKSQLQQNDFTKQVRRQIIIQSTLKHDNVLKLFGYFWDQKNIYLILEYAPGGELYRILKERRHFSEKEVSIIIRQVCQGIQYLHSKNIIHRDIKPENLLLSLGKVKIADFGWSIHTENRRDTLCGTLDYLAPQMVKGCTHDSSVDMWGLGILAYQLAVGNPPFQTNSYQATYLKIIRQQVIFPKHLSWQAKSFIGSLLRKCPKKRMTVNQALQDEFITTYRSENLTF